MATTIMQDADAVFSRAQQIIGQEMQTSSLSFQHMVAVWKKKIETNVYKRYTPHGKHPYIRRRENGGLIDPDMVQKIANGVDTIGIVDTRHETAVVESGVGYTWADSDIYAMQPYPRPFYEDAEDELIADGFIENQLQSALDEGFGV